MDSNLILIKQLFHPIFCCTGICCDAWQSGFVLLKHRGGFVHLPHAEVLQIWALQVSTFEHLCICMCIRSPVSPLHVHRHLAVPLKASERLFRLHWLLPIYFLFAVAYDIFQTIIEITENVPLVLHTNSSLGWESWERLDIRWDNSWDPSGMDSYYLTPNPTHTTPLMFSLLWMAVHQ